MSSLQQAVAFMRQESRVAPPPLGFGPGIWVTQPLASIREENKKWCRVITRSVGVSTLSTRCPPAFPFIGDVSCGCCPEDAISACVALVVDGVFVDVLLGFALRVRRRDALGVLPACRGGRIRCRDLMRGADGAN